MKYSACLLSVVLVACATHVASSPRTSPDITAEDLRQRLFAFAADSMMGRESGSAGDYAAAKYIAGEFKRLGLEPGGENGTYFQTVPFWRAAIDPTSQLVAGGHTLSTANNDFVPVIIPAASRGFAALPVVFGGSVADTAHLLPTEDGVGKLVVVEVPTSFARTAAAVRGRWPNAAGVALVVLEHVGPEIVARLREGRPIADTSTNARIVQLLWVSRPAATALFGADPAQLAAGTVGTSVSGHWGYTRTPVPYAARNVIGILRGRDPQLRGEYVSLSAHNDHVGYDHAPVDHDSLRTFNAVVRPMGADSPLRQPTAEESTRITAALDSLRRIRPPRPDSIRNGADDDGSGTVGLLEIAEKFASGPHPRRSILFVSHTGEEAGLIGSRWFTDHSTVPMDSIVAEIDEDMIGRGTSTDYPRGGTVAASPTYLEVVGAKRLSREFGDTLEAANARQALPFVFDYTYDAPGHPLQYYCRADHYSYARYGVPSVAFSRGEHMDYHQVTDEPQYISYPDLARVSRMVFDAALALGNMPSRPRLDAPKPALGTPCRQ